MSVFAAAGKAKSMPTDRITIVIVDGTIYLSAGLFMDLDFSSINIPENTHAFQFWDGKGWIEFTDTRPNQPINSKDEIPEWVMACIALWNQEFKLVDLATVDNYDYPECDWVTP